MSGVSSSSSRRILADSFGRMHNYLRMSLTEKCNLRCVYCMPAEGVTLSPSKELMTLDERKRIISVFADLGVTKMRFTGGEPTISNQVLVSSSYLFFLLSSFFLHTTNTNILFFFFLLFFRLSLCLLPAPGVGGACK